MPDVRLSEQQAPGLTVRERDRLGMIWRRITRLEERIANYQGRSDSMSQAEVSALRWVLREAALPEPPKLQTKENK